MRSAPSCLLVAAVAFSGVLIAWAADGRNNAGSAGASDSDAARQLRDRPAATSTALEKPRAYGLDDLRFEHLQIRSGDLDEKRGAGVLGEGKPTGGLAGQEGGKDASGDHYEPTHRHDDDVGVPASQMIPPTTLHHKDSEIPPAGVPESGLASEDNSASAPPTSVAKIVRNLAASAFEQGDIFENSGILTALSSWFSPSARPTTRELQDVVTTTTTTTTTTLFVPTIYNTFTTTTTRGERPLETYDKPLDYFQLLATTTAPPTTTTTTPSPEQRVYVPTIVTLPPLPKVGPRSINITAVEEERAKAAALEGVSAIQTLAPPTSAKELMDAKAALEAAERNITASTTTPPPFETLVRLECSLTIPETVQLSQAVSLWSSDMTFVDSWREGFCWTVRSDIRARMLDCKQVRLMRIAESVGFGNDRRLLVGEGNHIQHPEDAYVQAKEGGVTKGAASTSVVHSPVYSSDGKERHQENMLQKNKRTNSEKPPTGLFYLMSVRKKRSRRRLKIHSRTAPTTAGTSRADDPESGAHHLRETKQLVKINPVVDETSSSTARTSHDHHHNGAPAPPVAERKLDERNLSTSSSTQQAELQLVNTAEDYIKVTTESPPGSTTHGVVQRYQDPTTTRHLTTSNNDDDDGPTPAPGRRAANILIEFSIGMQSVEEFEGVDVALEDLAKHTLAGNLNLFVMRAQAADEFSPETRFILPIIKQVSDVVKGVDFESGGSGIPLVQVEQSATTSSGSRRYSGGGIFSESFPLFGSSLLAVLFSAQVFLASFLVDVAAPLQKYQG
ncbi:unnamed protein product [Amoebophrya sp. A120]|nr:unnamed protein product [Amoebophrya sp. A120]|eukprot:GSA120T00007454001.1